MWPVSDEEWERLNYPERFQDTQYLIKGITKAGAVFRPSDWSERLCSALAHYRDKPRLVSIDLARNHKMQGYSNCVMPVVVDGVKCVIVSSRLKTIESLAFEFVMNFAEDNNLVVEENYVKQQRPELEAA